MENFPHNIVASFIVVANSLYFFETTIFSFLLHFKDPNANDGKSIHDEYDLKEVCFFCFFHSFHNR